MNKTFYCYDGAEEFSLRCMEACLRHGLRRVTSRNEAMFAIAPRLTRKLSAIEWSAPNLGTLIFHPSILPYHRGPDAIRWAVLGGERVSGVTWFWCDDGLDTGPICEQEPVLLKPGESPGRAYFSRFLPAGLRALDRAIVGILAGRPRRVEQDESLSTYESAWLPDGQRFMCAA